MKLTPERSVHLAIALCLAHAGVALFAVYLAFCGRSLP